MFNILYTIIVETCDSIINILYTIIYSFYHLAVTKRHSTIINIDQAACLDYSAIGLTNPPPCKRKILTKTGLYDHTSHKTRCGNPSSEQIDKTQIKTQSRSFSTSFHRLTSFK